MLLGRLEELAAETRKNPALLARPVRIVVPSRSLRLHVGSAILRARGRSIAGVTIQTLHSLAFEVLERAGEPAPQGMPLFDVVAQRLARTERPLRQGLGDLVDGYAAVAGTVRDLLDAGLEPELLDAVDEALAADGPGRAGRAEIERARSLARVAAYTEALMRERGLGRVSTLLRRAAELLAADPDRALPSRAILIHGFADATGVATDLLQALLRRGALLILDHPPDPAGGGGAERAFTARFAERLGAVSRFVPAPPEPPSSSRLSRFEAAGTEAEAREVARRVRALLDGGDRPEGIGIVARDLGPYALPLSRHLRRLGVPFSGVGARGALEPAGRRVRAVLELLRRGEEVPADRWLDAVGSLRRSSSQAPLGGLLVDLRLAFYSLGAGRLRDVADLVIDRFLQEGSYPLPIRQGLREAEAEEENEEESGEREAYAARRRVDGRHLQAAVRAAGRLRERLADWPDEAPAEDHFRRVRALLTSDLGWSPGSETAQPVLAALAELEREVPAGFLLTREELRTLLGNSLADVGTAPLGGHGGGVQVLTVTEARGRTFEHLFLAGLNRDLFPRTVREDPLLTDDLRRVLQRVLPDVPIKRAGFDEERYLYAQLLAASPAVTLSWQTADADGRPVSPSPLLRGGRAEAKAPALYAPEPALRPADEHAVIAALHAPRSHFGEVLAVALEEAWAQVSSPDTNSHKPQASSGLPEGSSPLLASPLSQPPPSQGGGTARFPSISRSSRLAAVRVAVLDELDPDLRTPDGRATRARLGPYFGFIGATAPGTDPRHRDLFVTHMESLAGCPWQLFLGRLLQLEPTPDPLAALPGADPLLLGNAVHATLERIVRRAAGEEEEGAEDRPREGPVLVPWPASEEIDRLLLDVSAALLAAEGITLPGLAQALAQRARPLVDAAGAVDWDHGSLTVLRAESKDAVTIRDAAGRSRTLHFRADRVDPTASGLRFTDYKTGRPLSSATKPEYRHRHFLDRVRAGSHLQAVAYLLATGEPAVGRYLYLRPGLQDDERDFTATLGDRDLTAAFERAAQGVLGAWDSGSFFPRVVDPAGRKEPARCNYCHVAEACLRGDSGARNRLFEWTEKARAEPSTLDPAAQALLAVWRLPAKESRDKSAEAGESGEDA
jgi:superfamily I DNA/RNA helicase